METFRGKITNTIDALIIFEACRQGVLPRTTRRMVEEEKENLSAGSVFVYDEIESKIKRWTDGRNWSPSRVVGDFLVYKELEMRFPHVKSYDNLNEKVKKRIKDENLKVLISNKGAYIYRKGGLSKKTITVKLNDSMQHMVIYESKEGTHNLYPPCAYVEFSNIEPAIDLTHNEMLRKHKGVTFDDTPAPKLHKINESKNIDIRSPIARNGCNENAVEQPGYSFNIPLIRSAYLTKGITEALYSNAGVSQEIFDADVSDVSSSVGLPQGNDQINEELENLSPHSNLDQLIDDDINIWSPNVFQAYTHLTTVVVRDNVILDTSSNNPVNSDYFGLIDFSRL